MKYGERIDFQFSFSFSSSHSGHVFSLSLSLSRSARSLSSWEIHSTDVDQRVKPRSTEGVIDLLGLTTDMHLTCFVGAGIDRCFTFFLLSQMSVIVPDEPRVADECDVTQPLYSNICFNLFLLTGLKGIYHCLFSLLVF